MQFSGGETPLEKQAGLFEAPKAGTGPGLGTSSSSATATAPPPQQPEGPSAEETKASNQRSYPWLTFRTAHARECHCQHAMHLVAEACRSGSSSWVGLAAPCDSARLAPRHLLLLLNEKYLINVSVP